MLVTDIFVVMFESVIVCNKMEKNISITESCSLYSLISFEVQIF